MKTKFLYFVLAVFLLAPALGDVAGAQVIIPGTIPDNNKLGITTGSPIERPSKILEILAVVVQYVYTIFFAVAVMIFIFVAFKYLTSGGDAASVQKVHMWLVWGVIAVVVALLSVGVSAIVNNFLGNPRV